MEQNYEGTQENLQVLDMFIILSVVTVSPTQMNVQIYHLEIFCTCSLIMSLISQ